MKNFAQLNLILPLQQALSEQGYLSPTPIQAQTLPAAIDGQDILGCAQTGTGKTAAFALPILNGLGKNQIKPQPNYPKALVVAPTRELAIQIGDSFRTYGRHLRLKVAMVYGGVSQHHQVRQLDRGAHILIATPGRLLDLMSQGYVRLDGLEVFVLDEADRMLDMGFLPDLNRIIKALPQKRQSLFFSATLPPKVRSLTKQLLCNPINVDVTPKTASVIKIDQRVVLVERHDKQSVLKLILAAPGVERAIVFTRTKRGANRLSERLERQGIKSTAIHGNKSQAARQKALTAFRNARINVLVATDVAARGIDIDGVTHVVNFDIPNPPENYVHRIGRTGRAGASGVALSLCSPDETGELRAIERLIGKKVPVTKRPESTRKVTVRVNPRHGSSARSKKPATRSFCDAPRNRRSRSKSLRHKHAS